MKTRLRPSNVRHAAFWLAPLVAVFAQAQSVWAQDTKKANPASDLPAWARPGNLIARYRMVERYTTKDDPGASGYVGQYQVAFKETISGDRPTNIKQARYTERPAVLDPASDQTVTDTVRYYQTVEITPDPWKDRTDRRPMVDLEIWYRERALEAPEVLVLSKDRALREEEYVFAINYEFVTKYTFLLPETPDIRIGDVWRVRLLGAEALINEEIHGGFLQGRLSEILAHPTEKGMLLATIDVTGKVESGNGRFPTEVSVRAQLKFAFRPVATPGDDTLVDAYGMIERLALGQKRTMTLPGGSSVSTRDFILERKARTTEPLLKIPNPAPSATPENSWLTRVDPKNRFYFRHPQSFRPPPAVGETNLVTVVHPQPDRIAADLVSFDFRAKHEAEPEKVFQVLKDDWKSQSISVLVGPSQTLPASEWHDFAVHHMEVALKSDTNAAIGRRFFDAYVLQFPGEASILVSATTFQDQPGPFRKQVEGMMKSLKLGTPPK